MAHIGRTDRWEYLPNHAARAMVYSALRTMRKCGGGPFTNREVAEIVQDVMELPEDDCDISKWDKRKCKQLILRLLVRGLIYDPNI